MSQVAQAFMGPLTWFKFGQGLLGAASLVVVAARWRRPLDPDEEVWHSRGS